MRKLVTLAVGLFVGLGSVAIAVAEQAPPPPAAQSVVAVKEVVDLMTKGKKDCVVMEHNAVFGGYVAALLIPLAAAVATLVTSIVLFAIASVKAPAVLPLAAYLWSPSVWVGWVGTLLYLTLASALWFLPVIGLNLLVSAWAPRSPLGYAAMVPAAIMLAERVVFGTNVFWRAVVAFYAGFPQHALVRSGGSLTINFENPGSLDASVTAFDFIHPLGFLATPALWVYVALGAAMIAGAIGLRRYRDSVA